MSEPAPPNGLIAELWFAHAPDLSDPTLLAGLKAISPDAEAQRDSLVVPYVPADGTDARAHVPPGDGQARPLLTIITPGSPLGTDGKARPDTGQTWDWPEAEAVVGQADGSVLVTEMFAAGWSARERVGALTSVVAALAAATRPLAISWPTSQRVSDPAAWRPEDLDGILNVRLFSVPGDDDPLVMDTLGLGVFDLPDVQCHFRDLNPGQLAPVLFSTGAYLFEAGDVIADGDTISGLGADERWVCHHEASLVAPRRTVVDVDPGDPYAVDRRR